MGYKMKGPSLYKDKLCINRNGYDNMPDGKSKSSPFQDESSPIDNDLFGPNKGKKKKWRHSKWNPRNWFRKKNLSRKGTVMSTRGK